jgi:hypothetical protein
MSIVVPIYATTSKLPLSRRPSARKRRFAFRRWRFATPAMAVVPRPVRSRRPVRPVRAAVRFDCNRDSSQSSRPAPSVTAPAVLLPSLCGACHGAGRVKQHKTLAVKIPAGVDEGDRIRLSGEGEHGINGGPSGDLYVQIHLKSHPVFQREQNDLHCEMPISFTTAALGGEIDIPTLDGVAKIRVPPETQSGKTFACAAKASRGFAAITTATCFVTWWWKPRFISPNVRRNCCASLRSPVARTLRTITRAPSPGWIAYATSLRPPDRGRRPTARAGRATTQVLLFV